EKKEFSQHTNAMAVLVGLLPEDKNAELMERVLSDRSLIQCTYYYRFYLVRALVKAGLANRYLDLLAPWQDMLDLRLTTFAEEPEPTRSDCHAWSASPLYEFLATVCGITPASPGFKRIRIEPQPGRLEKINCIFPHPVGTVELELTRQGPAGIQGRVSLPAGLDGEFVWQGRAVELHPGSQDISLP
ncbi:MAG TPA: alpha-L-rhamnosidase C-terminal domain-containing protein, partial [Candidatus Glassbacteria bacterium]|nr:alpha-L-rhamnosidase C-terminal domain-containing protein [Candidatus Glassbacteria bacterium]